MIDYEENRIPFLYGKLNKEIQKGILKETTIIPNGEEEIITPEKEYDGFSKVTIPAEPNLIPENIIEGKTIYGIEGTAKEQKDDPNLQPYNIKEDVTIYGVTGTVKELYKDTNLIPENIREDITVYEDTVAETTGTLIPETTDINALIGGTLTQINYKGTTIRDTAFYYYTALESFVGDNVTTIGESAFSMAGNSSNLLTINLKSVSQLPTYCFSQSKIKTFTGNSVIQIGTNCFNQCTELTSVTLSNINNLSDNCFAYCNKLSTLNANLSNVQIIGQNCFRNCNNLGNLDFSQSNIRTLSSGSFMYYHSDNTNRTILDFRSSSFSKIPSSCFRYVSHCDIYLPELSSGNIITLDNTSAIGDTVDVYIYVPSSKLSTYQSASNWSTYTSILRSY